MSDQPPTSTRFDTLGLDPTLLEGIHAAGYTHGTPIQSQTLPVALTGRDVAGQAQTGTGKTAAFLIALFNLLLTRPAPPGRTPTSVRALVVAPDARTCGADPSRCRNHRQVHGLRTAVVYGGTDYEKQRRQLTDGIDVLIGTPGRLIDYFKQHVFDLRHAAGAGTGRSGPDVRSGVHRRYPVPDAPPAAAGRRLSMLFSATLSQRVLELAYEHMNNPELVRIEPDKMTVDRVRQVMYYPSMEEKLPLLISLLRQADARRTMIFVNTKRMAERLESVLNANGFNAQAISGDVPQPKRLRFLRPISTMAIWQC